jgi:serine kinase of HPr protein (carbohydrate metabolism regulator)
LKTENIIKELGLTVLAGGNALEKDINGIYCCDLLSWVMSHGSRGNAWITVQIHPNVVAVASLLEFSCIIVPELIDVEKVTLEKANQENIPILQSKENAYKICSMLHDLGL